MINPDNITTIRVDQLAEDTLSLVNEFAHTNGTELKKATIQSLVDLVSAAVGAGSGVGFLPISVTDGQQLPDVPAEPSFFLAGIGTYLNINGYPDLICTEELNAIMSLTDHWEIAVEIPIAPLSGGVQSVTGSAVDNTDPLNPIINSTGGGGAVDSVNGQTGDVILDIPTNTSDLINDGEDGVHPYITLLDLPSNLILYPTTVASDVSGYVKLVTDIHDPEYNEPAVDVSTGSITTTNQLVASLITVPNLISGNPGVFNISTVGNIRRSAGSGTAEFYFNVYKRDSLGTETLVGVSNPTLPVNNGVYAEFSSTAIWDDGVFTATDRIVLKFYGSRIAGGSNPTYEFQFGGLTPVRTLVPIPLSVVPITTTPTLQEVTDVGNVIFSDDNLNKIVIDKVTQAVRFYGKSLITDPFVLATEYTQYGLYIDQMYNFGVNKIKLEAGEGLVLDDNYGNMIVISAYSATKNGVEFATLSDIPTVANATETVAGIAEIATTTEVATGTDDERIITPLKLKAVTDLKVDKTSWIDISATSTIVGWSSFTTKVIRYKIINDIAFVEFILDGTSNSTSTNFTLPFNSPVYTNGIGSYVTNNGIVSDVPPRFEINASSNLISIRRSFSAALTTWAASGNKAVLGQFFIKIS